MPTATVSSKSQIALPAEIRRRLGIRPGDRLTISVEDEHIVLQKTPASDLEALAAFCSPLWQGQETGIAASRDEWPR